MCPPRPPVTSEPYGIRVMLLPASDEFDPREFLVSFLQDLAAACLASGASVIGHLKCLLHTPGHAFACNLTSLREGANCSVRPVQGHVPGAMPAPVALERGKQARLDLAVLVYGLPAVTIDVLVRAALTRLLGPLDVSWSIPASDPADLETLPLRSGGRGEAKAVKQCRRTTGHWKKGARSTRRLWPRERCRRHSRLGTKL